MLRVSNRVTYSFSTTRCSRNIHRECTVNAQSYPQLLWVLIEAALGISCFPKERMCCEGCCFAACSPDLYSCTQKISVQFLRDVENRGLGDCSTRGIKNARDCTSVGVWSRRSGDARTGQTEDWHLASQLKTSQVHQVASRCFFSYYYKRVTFCGVIEKSHTYFEVHHQG